MVALAVDATPAGRQATVPGRPLETALYPSPTSPIAEMDRVAPAGATKVRLTAIWSSVAPKVEPAVWDPTNPADPNYDWKTLDAAVLRAKARRLDIYVTVLGAPKWAQAPPASADPFAGHLPDPAAFGSFARALATRFSGSFERLPRVRFFQAWNEPNISLYLTPQIVRRRPVSPRHYRRMLNAFAAAVHAVRRDNVVIVGGLAPFRDITPAVRAQDRDWGPLSFMRGLLCISRSLRPTCKTKVDFDIWATHPYTSGGPSHHAVLPNDVSLGDLPQMRAVLQAAARHGQLANRRPGFWVTEFSWDSRPPDPKGVPTALHTRWVAEALYRMWQNGVTVVTWLQTRDQRLSQSYYQSGLWYVNGRPKPALRAFRFPFVAFRSQGGVFVWGRAPHGRPGRVLIQQSVNGEWRQLRVVVGDRFGIFRATVTGHGRGQLRAVVAATQETSVLFSLRVPADRFFNPFGLPTRLEPRP
jgi:hypothetical protein